MLDAEDAAEVSAVGGEPRFERDKDRGRERRQAVGAALQLVGAPLQRCRERHAAVARGRSETRIDFEVGVSLSRPALARGTRTFSSG